MSVITVVALLFLLTVPEGESHLSIRCDKNSYSLEIYIQRFTLFVASIHALCDLCKVPACAMHLHTDTDILL